LRYGINYSEPYGNILKKREKEWVEGWELATFIIVIIIQPLLMQKCKKFVGALNYESPHQPSKQIV
jgi:hypothetical protein